MIATLCSFPGCGCLAVPGHKYCTKHLEESQKKRELWKKEHRPFKNAKRNNSQFYNTKEWRLLRIEVFNNYGNCCCLCGQTAEQSGFPLEIHHKIPPQGNRELFFDKDNCIPLCKVCHARITAREQEEKKANG